jgi:tetratricopeptide (TPR) repeat protein
VQDGDAWTASRDIEHVPVPPTIQALLAARLDQLEEDERVVIEAAAVGGKVFYEDAVATLVPADSAERVAALLGALLRKELIRSDRPSLGGRTFRFRHLLIRDAAYDAIPKEARAGLHERFADWLEDAAGTRLAEYEEVIGYHLEQAYRYRVALGIGDSANQLLGRRAAERLGSAGRRAFARSDSSAGMNLVSRAVTLLPAADALRVELVPNVRVVQGGAADMSWADRALTEAVEAAATSGDRGLAARALVQRALLRLFTASDVTPAELLDVAGRAAAVFGELGDDLGLARAHRLKAQSHYLDRRGAACAEASEVAFEHARRTGDPFENQEIAEWLEIALLLGPTPASVAAERLDRLVAETRDHPATHAGALAALGAAQAMLCRFADADRSLEQATAIVAERGESVWLLAFWQGWVHVWQQRYADADRVLRRACETLRAIGEKTHFTTQALGLADVAYLDARYTEVDALTQEVERAIRPNDVHSQILWRGVRAKMLARRGEHEAAEELAREGVAYASETDFLIAHGDAYASLAEVLIVQGDSAAAGAALEEAIGVYEAKEHFAGIGMIRPRLASLR